jgi:hypothetical protein
VGFRHADHVAPSIRKKLALTSLASGGRSVGIVRLRTEAMEFSLWLPFSPPSRQFISVTSVVETVLLKYKILSKCLKTYFHFQVITLVPDLLNSLIFHASTIGRIWGRKTKEPPQKEAESTSRNRASLFC